MRLASNWEKRARHSKSFKLNAIGVILSSVALAFPYLFGVIDISPTLFVVILLVINLMAGLFRLMYNPELDD